MHLHEEIGWVVLVAEVVVALAADEVLEGLLRFLGLLGMGLGLDLGLGLGLGLGVFGVGV